MFRHSLQTLSARNKLHFKKRSTIQQIVQKYTQKDKVKIFLLINVQRKVQSIVDKSLKGKMFFRE
jgi:hypothetical protein